MIYLEYAGKTILLLTAIYFMITFGAFIVSILVIGAMLSATNL